MNTLASSSLHCRRACRLLYCTPNKRFHIPTGGEGKKKKTPKQPLIPSCPISSQWKWLQKGGGEARLQTGNPLGQVVGASSFHSHSPSTSHLHLCLPPPTHPPTARQHWQASPSRNRKAIWCLFGTVRRQDVLCCVCQQSCLYWVCLCVSV